MKKLIVVLLMLVATAYAKGPRATSGSFTDDFNTGVLDARWVVSNWNAPGPGVFRSYMVDLSQGTLCLKLTQDLQPDGSIASTGGEISTSETYGYGTYEWTMRTSSTSSTPFGIGAAVSGQVSAGFNWTNGSKTEVDFEVEGQKPNLIEMTSWSGTSHSIEVDFPFIAPDAGFHRYKYVWRAGRIDFYLDDVPIATITTNVPTSAAHVYINHWGTDSTNFGGLATTGVTRYLYVSKFSFTAAP